MRDFDLAIASILRLCALFLLCLSSAVSALNDDFPDRSEPRYRFQRLSIDQGLSQSIVDGIVQDEFGFMWFATEDGLNKFDGYRFSVLRNDPKNPNSLSHNQLLSVITDKKGHLWIGTFNGGLNKYIPATGQFFRYYHTSDDTGSLSDDVVYAVCEDEYGNIWIGTNAGLNVLRSKTRSDRPDTSIFFSAFQHNPDDPASLSHNSVRVLYADKKGLLWIGTDNGLNVTSVDSSIETIACRRFYHDPEDRNSLSHNQIRAIYRDSEGTMWIGTEGGLNRLEPEKRDKPIFTRFRHMPDDPESLGHDAVYEIFEDRYGFLWIGTNGGGLDVFDRSQNRFYHYRNDPRNLTSLSYDEIRAIYEDRSGNLWIGTYGGGISKVDRSQKKFKHYKSDPDNPNSLNEDIVWCIFEDEDGILWIGTHGGGLNRFDRRNNRFRQFRADPTKPGMLSHDIVRIVLEDRNGLFWIGTHGGGINIFDRKTERFRTFMHDAVDPGSLSNNEIRSILEDDSGTIWIGTRGGGVDRLLTSQQNVSNPRFYHYRHDAQDSTSLSSDFVRTIFQDRNGEIWVGTQGAGLNKLDKKTGTFTHFRADPENPRSLSNDFIFSIYEDSDGFLWLGTWGGGLNRFDPETGLFTFYTEKDGLPNDAIYGILEDSRGYLWLSTNNGLSRFDPRAKTFRNYDVTDGLQSNEFNGGAYFKSSTGEFFFGGINGFNAFFPEEIVDNPYVPPVVITSFLKMDREIDLGKPIWDISEIELSHKDYFFSFEFAALDYTAPAKNRYAYMMEGLDKEWIYTGAAKRYASYTTLAPRTYTFRVKASNNDGIWNEEGLAIRVTIRPPFWQTLWFKSIAVAVLSMIAVGLYKQRIKHIEKKREELEIRVKEKTESARALQKALTEVESLKDRLQAENIYLQDEIKLVHNFENIITQSQGMKEVLRSAEQVALTDATVLITGESGTGKELLARAIHNISQRKSRPLVKVDCTVLPPNLIESELFGHEKGAYTGAISQRIGRFELADGGTIFLDEIGDLPLEVQAKLLRVLQDGEIERLGNPRTIHVDVRVIAATNRDLDNEIRSGRFREDLYYRLHVFPIEIPPLRERKEDIALLVRHFMQKFGKKSGKDIEDVPKNVMNMLHDYHWPGNVRELENILERALILSTGRKLALGDWLQKGSADLASSEIQTLEQNERKHILKALEVTGWRVSGEKGAAHLLDINPQTLVSRMKKLKIERRNKNL